MPLPSSGPITINQIRAELGSGSYSLRTLSAAAGKSTPDAMSEFYGFSMSSQTFVGFTSEGGRTLSVTLRSAGVSISPLLDLNSGGCSTPSISGNVSPTTTTTVSCELRFRSAVFEESYSASVKAYNRTTGGLVFSQTVNAEIVGAGASVFVNITGLTAGVSFYYEILVSSSNCNPYPNPNLY